MGGPLPAGAADVGEARFADARPARRSPPSGQGRPVDNTLAGSAPPHRKSPIAWQTVPAATAPNPIHVKTPARFAAALRWTSRPVNTGTGPRLNSPSRVIY